MEGEILLMAKKYAPVLSPNGFALPNVNLSYTSPTQNVSKPAIDTKQTTKPIIATKLPVVPKIATTDKTSPIKFKSTPTWSDVQTAYNISQPGLGDTIAKNLSPQEKQKIVEGTKQWFKEAPTQAGYMQGVSLTNPLKSLERKLGTTIDAPTDSLAYKAGNLAGIATQFAVPYSGAAKGVGAVTKSVLPNLGKVGSNVAKSVATDIAVGLPLNVNYAFNKEGLQGKDALKSIAINTAVDLISGGILETAPIIIKGLKGNKKIASKVDFDNLTEPEQREIVTKLMPKISQTEYQDSLVNFINSYNKGTNVGNLNTDAYTRLLNEYANVSEMKPQDWIEYSQVKDLGNTAEFTDILAKNNARRVIQPTESTVQPSLERNDIVVPQTQKVAETGDLPPSAASAEINGLQKDLGADIYKVLPTTEENIAKYGALPKGEQLVDELGNPITKEVEVPKGTAYGDTQQYARTLLESPIVDDTLAKDIQDSIVEGYFSKVSKSNEVAVSNANKMIEDDFDKAFDYFKSIRTSGKIPTSEDIALGTRFVQEFQKRGDYNNALEVSSDLATMLSETGRTLQAAQIAKRLSPEGRLRIVAKIQDRVKKQTGIDIKLKDTTLKKISDAKTEKDITRSLHDASVEIYDQVPATWMDKLNAWRYMAMLTNPKTHVRNIIGNAMFIPVRQMKNIVGAGLEKALIKDGKRTKSIANRVTDKPLYDFASKDFENVVDVIKAGGKLDKGFRELDSKVFKTKALENLRQFNMNALDREDTYFIHTSYVQSLAQYMKANKINPENITKTQLLEARNYATKEALKATYRDSTKLVEGLSHIRSKLSRSESLVGKVGSIALEGAMPFTKTPINILRRGIEYSPIGVINAVSDALTRVKSGKMSATEAIDELAAGLTGTGIMALGAFLASQGFLSGKTSDYFSKEGQFEQLQGSQNYALQLPDGSSYTIDWMAPVSMPLFVGVEIANSMQNKGANPSDIIDSITSIPDPLFNMSMLQGINNIFTTIPGGEKFPAADIIKNAGLSYVGQYNPTFFGQVARTIDPIRRSTTSTEEAGIAKDIDKFLKKQSAKIPGLSSTNEPYIDQWGRNTITENPVERVVANFVSPGYLKPKVTTFVDKRLSDLSSRLDEETANSILPRDTNNYTLVRDGKDYRMSEKELTTFKEVRGKEAYNKLSSLFSSSQYLNAPDEAKVKLIKKVYDDAFESAKNKIFKE